MKNKSAFQVIAASLLILMNLLFSVRPLRINAAPRLSGQVDYPLSTWNNANWNKYSNPEMGYSLEYPSTMVYREWDPAADILHSVSFYLAQDSDSPLYRVPEIAITVFSNPQRLTSKEWLTAHSGREGAQIGRSSAAFFGNITEPTTVIVDGLRAIAFGESFGSIHAERIIIARDASIFSMSYTDFGKQKLRSIYWDMVSTVKWSNAQSDGMALLHTVGPKKLPDTLLGVDRQVPQMLSSPGYRLPWTRGETYRVAQGWGGTTHTCPGQMCYAYDFDSGSASFEGVVIRASSGGNVAYIKNDVPPDTCGGYDYRNLANYVTVYHSDGTATLYLHLKQVNVGYSSVGQGDVLGLAGKTGWTGCHPHLHFQRQNQGGWITNSMTIYFDEYPGDQLEYNQWVTSQNGSSSTCPAPALVSPGNGVTVNNRTVSFQWNAPSCTGLDVYTFRVADHPDIDNPPWIIDHGVVPPSTSTTENIPPEYDGKTLYWAVWAHNGAGYGPKGGPWSFRVDTSAPPPPPPIPSGAWKAEYFNGTNFESKCAPDGYIDESFLFYDWGDDAPADGCNRDEWSARFTKRINFQGGTYKFGLGYDDGARIKIDGTTVVDGWAPATQHYETRDITAGEHEVTVEFYDNAGWGLISAWWTGPGFDLPQENRDEHQWYTEYWGNKRLWWDAPVRVNEGTGFLDRTWGDDGPGYGLLSDRFSARFRRKVYFKCGRYRFTYGSDDGMRFKLGGDSDPWWDDSLWNDHGYNPVTLDRDISEGEHEIQVEFYNNSGWAQVSLRWNLLQRCAPSPPTLASPITGAWVGEGDDITLSWTGDGEQYWAEYNRQGESTTVHRDWNSETQWQIGHLEPGYVYEWRVKARNGTGSVVAESDWSDPWTFTVHPSAPTNITATAETCDNVQLTWTDTSDGEDGFNIYRDDQTIGHVSANTTSYTDANVSEGATYKYVVAAVKNNVESFNNGEVSVTVPACTHSNNPPNTPTLLSPPNGSTHTSMPQLCGQDNGDPDGDAVEFQVYLTGDAAEQSGWITDTCWKPSVTASGTYTWYVQAKDDHGNTSDYSPDWTFTISSGLSTSIAVNTTSDVDDGDTTSFSALLQNPGADGKISLREALRAANNMTGTKTITFTIPTSDPGYDPVAQAWTIQPQSQLPALSSGHITLDATSQGTSVYDGPAVELNGDSAGGAYGLLITSGYNHVRGFVINSFSYTGINLSGSQAVSNTITANYIGTDSMGVNQRPNGMHGISNSQGASYNLIGGTDPADRNVISGNNWKGIENWGDGTAYNVIRGNYIGVDATGTQPLGNHSDGVSITPSAHDILVVDNVIAFNGLYGVEVGGGAVVNHNTISRNSIYHNRSIGISIDSASNTNGGIRPPQIISATTTYLAGTACPNCIIEVFSDEEDEGHYYEGTVTADANGAWTWRGTPSLPRFTATATDAVGNTSGFSRVKVSGECITASPHPYENDTDHRWEISNPDTSAQYSRIHFTRIGTEQDYDYVYIEDEAGTRYQTLTGSYRDIWSALIPGKKIFVHLMSNSSIRDWGFCVDAIETAAPPGGSGAILSVRPASQEVSVSSSTITTTVVISDVNNLGGFEVTLVYDPSVVHVEDVTLGDFLSSTGRTVSPLSPQVDNTTGRVIFGGYSLGTQPGPSGTGVLATVTLSPQDAGQTDLILQNSQVVDISGSTMEVTNQNGHITVTECPRWDVDCDGDVDISDIMQVAGHWNCKQGDTCYNSKYDIDQDGDIDVADIMIVAGHWNCKRGDACYGGGVLPRPLHQTDGVRMSIPPARMLLGARQTVIPVRVDQASHLGAVELTLEYDPNVIEITGVEQGSWGAGAKRKIVVLKPQWGKERGYVPLGLFSYGEDMESDKTGELFYIHVRPVAIGVSHLVIKDVQATTAKGNALKINTIGGYVVVIPESKVYLPTIVW